MTSEQFWEREMKQHFVTFYSPGTFVAETTDKPIDSWDVDKAKEMAHEVVERYGATPYGFRFTTYSRGPKDLNSKQSAKSPLYHLGGRVETFAQVEARNDPKEDVLRSNMRCNDISKVVINDNSYRSTQPLGKDDVVLDWEPRAKRKAAKS